MTGLGPDGLAAASRLLEQVARERGLAVHRLTPELLVCTDGQRRVVFHGLAGTRPGRVTEVLCGNDAWLRAYLARCGLPVVPTRLVDLSDAGYAQRAAEELGFPVRLRLATTPDGPIASDVEPFHEHLHALQEQASSLRAPVILEVPSDQTVDLAVVGGHAVVAGQARDLPAPEVHDLAVRAVVCLPGTRCGLVRVTGEASGPRLDSVDPAFRAGFRSGGVTGAELGSAILDLEFRSTT